MAYRPSAGRQQRGAGEPKPPDLVPIMNLFVTIIPLLLMLTVISQVALVALNFSAGGGGGGEGSGGNGKEQAKVIKLIIMADDIPERKLFKGFEVRVDDKTYANIYNIGNRYNFMQLDQVLSTLKSENQDLQDITIVAYDTAKYGTLIQTIDLCKYQKRFPVVHYEALEVVNVVGGM